MTSYKHFWENRKLCCELRRGVTLTQEKFSKANVQLLDKKKKVFSFGGGVDVYSIK